MLAARPHLRGPQRPAVGGGDDLDVAAGRGVLARPPQVHPPLEPGAEQRSVRISVPSTCRWAWPAARAASSAPRSLGATAAASCANRVPSTNQRSTSHRLPIAAQRPPARSSTPAAPLDGQQPRHEQHRLLGDRQHSGVADSIRHAGPRWPDIREKTSLLPGSCVHPGHPRTHGVSPPTPAARYREGSIRPSPQFSVLRTGVIHDLRASLRQASWL